MGESCYRLYFQMKHKHFDLSFEWACIFPNWKVLIEELWLTKNKYNNTASLNVYDNVDLQLMFDIKWS